MVAANSAAKRRFMNILRCHATAIGGLEPAAADRD
jgi:hypothetical protein